MFHFVSGIILDTALLYAFISTIKQGIKKELAGINQQALFYL